MDSKQKYKVIGLMSGTSLDGIDIAYCTFHFQKGWKYTIEKAETLAYTTPWLKKLKEAHRLPAEKLIELDHAYGNFLGTLCKNFIDKHQLRSIDFIASHGHTIFHQPEKKFTLQIGNGNAIHAVAGLPVIYDFRSLDVTRGGQGAPLVPIGDKLLFGDYDVCLNLGGIANVSMEKKNRIAFDVCYVNMGLNYLSNLAGKKYDRNGALANAGEVKKKMLDQLDRAYAKVRLKRPSLGREFFETHIQPILDKKDFSLEDRLRTFTESTAKEITSAILEAKQKPTVLCTGGGAFNSFLIYQLIEHGGDAINLVIPENEIINFKEALVFAFLGVLRTRGESNCLKSVTGASRDSSGGVTVGF
jgi:anhydro-N-acetylmuramic acid kinase